MALDLILPGPIFSFNIADDAEYIEYLLDSFVGCLNRSLFNSSWFGILGESFLALFFTFGNRLSNKTKTSGSIAIPKLRSPIVERNTVAIENQK